MGSCPKCAAEVVELAIVRRACVPRGMFTPSSEFRSRIQRQIAVPRRRSLVSRLVPATILAAAVLLVASDGRVFASAG